MTNVQQGWSIATGRPELRRAAGFAAALAITLSAPATAGNASEASKPSPRAKVPTSDVYIVRLAEQPVAAYSGGIPGYAATASPRGQKTTRNNPNAQRYSAYLQSRHDGMLAGVGASAKLYSYSYSFNGFAAVLSGAQAARLAATPGVISIEKDLLRKPDTSTTPAFLGLAASGGLWSQLGGVRSAGEGVVVGIIDTGLWPENPSFSDQTDLAYRTGSSGKAKLAYGPAPASWGGTCQSGERWSQDSCNNKVIGARYFLSGFGHFGIVKQDFKSARDYDGHGSHTASTAAGNHGVTPAVPNTSFGKISGMAPRARLAVYKVCWNGDDGGCANSDSVAAIDAAVADGVDVLNFSISGTSTNFLDAVEIAFLFAARGNVFVAASAGNSGPGASTVAHISPWLTTVAAGTHDRRNLGTLTLGNGAKYTGVSVAGTATPTAPLVLSTAVGAAGADATAVRLCTPGTLDPTKVGGRIVVCDRGVIDRVAKSLAVKQAGGVGMVLANTAANQSLNADFHSVPTVHFSNVEAAPVKAYAGATGATGTIAAAVEAVGFAAPEVAAFSSRGPALASADILKPDLMAPGVDVLAAYSPALGGFNFNFLSGTSMSSPHVAGLGALLRQKHPSWSPAMIKSALMTSSGQLQNNGTPIAGTPFDFGAGQVAPTRAADPGLVYDAGFVDYLGFLCGTGQLTASYCPGIRMDPSDLNIASIAIGELAGIQTIKRRVTNVGAAAIYTPTVVAPAGVAVEVNPSSLSLGAGGTADYTVKFTTQPGAGSGPVFGSLTWVDGVHEVRSPLVVRPVALAAPAQVNGSGGSGSLAFNVTQGYSGAFAARARGLIPAATIAGTVADDPSNSFAVGGPGVTAHEVTIPAGTKYARFALFDAAVDGAHDLDLYVYSGSTLVGSSGGGTAQEEVSLDNPAQGIYTVYVHGWQTAGGGPARYTLFSWALGESDAGNLALTAPTTASIGVSVPITVGWNGLAAATRYLGAVSFDNVASPPSYESGSIGRTIVRIDTP